MGRLRDEPPASRSTIVVEEISKTNKSNRKRFVGGRGRVFNFHDFLLIRSFNSDAPN
jgi:hypothetical protein